MAGDWIPIRKGLKNELEVMRLSVLSGLPARTVVSILIDFWAWVDTVTTDGIITGVTLDQMSAFCPDVVPSFWGHLRTVGWLAEGDGFLEVPNFDRWMGNSAKKRLRERLRKRYNRQLGENVRFSSAGVPPQNGHKADIKADKKRTTEQNRTEQNRKEEPPLPPTLDTREFREAWSRWERHRREIRKPLTPTHRATLLAQLAGWGPGRAVAAIDHTIAKGWQGLREPDPPAPAAHGRAAESPAEKIARIRKEDECRRSGTAGPPGTSASSG